MSTEKIIALHASLQDADTGAPVTHFVIAQYTVRLLNAPGSQAVLQGYVSRAAYEAGKRPLMNMAIEVPAAQVSGVDMAQWLYAQIPTVEGIDLYGAVPVLASV